MRAVKLILMFGAVLTLLLSCSSSRFVEPLRRGENALALDFGGPIVSVPGVATIPIPFSSLTYGRGLTQKLTAFGSWYTTASVFNVWQFDCGVVREIWYNSERKMGVTLSPQANFAFDSFENNFSFWPILESNFHWKYKFRFQQQDDLLNGSKQRYNFIYAGVNTWFELKGTKAHGVKQTTRVVPNFHIGHSIRRNDWSFNVEMKMLSPFSNNESVVLDYRSILGSQGATGVYIGVIKRF